MTEETTPTEPSTEAISEERTIFDQHDRCDWFLAQLIHFADMGVEMSLTVIIEGQMISGTLIGGRTYFEEVAQTAARSGGSDSIAKSMSEMFATYKAVYRSKEEIGAATELPDPPAYIHLRNAIPILGGSGVNGKGTLWRAKLASISGFTMNAMSSR